MGSDVRTHTHTFGFAVHSEVLNPTSSIVLNSNPVRDSKGIEPPLTLLREKPTPLAENPGTAQTSTGMEMAVEKIQHTYRAKRWNQRAAKFLEVLTTRIQG